MRLRGELARLRLLWRPIKIRNYLLTTNEPALHIGCGGLNSPGWFNVDKFSANADTYLDASRRFPFKDDSFSLIFTEHMIEHLEIDRIQQFLSEILRVLRPGGICRITCPSLELYARYYVENDRDFFQNVMQGIERKRRKRPEQTWIVRTNGSAFMTGVVKTFYGHRWMYDFETLEACLKAVGFRNTIQRAFQESESTRLANMDNPDRAFETLYVEASK